MGLRPSGSVALPEHVGRGGFDHAAVDPTRGLVFVAHTANDAVDVIDTRTHRYLRSIPGLTGVAGALVDAASDLVFTSNRGEDTIGMFAPDAAEVTKVAVGIRPNGLAYDPTRGMLLSANVGDAERPGTASVTLVDMRARAALGTLAMPGRTRWTVFDPEQRVFFVNIADPFEIVVVDPAHPEAIARRLPVPARGPHGLDLDRTAGRLYCACDDGTLVALDSRSGAVVGSLALSGAPDVIFLNAERSRLYVAIGDPGVIDVIDVARWTRAETVATGRGAHTIAFDDSSHTVYAFLPETHEAAVFVDQA